MKKIFVFAAVIISTTVLMLSLGVNFTWSAETMMDKDMMMKHGDMTGDMMMEKGQMMMDRGKMMREGKMDKDRWSEILDGLSPEKFGKYKM